MVKVLFALILVGGIAGVASASPLLPTSSAHSVVMTDPIVQVKNTKARPYGWSQGRKVGWRGKKVPPGHQKKRYR